MNFFGMGIFEILVVLLAAFIFLGPERMAQAARTLGRWTGEFRRMSAGMQAEIDGITDAAPTAERQPTPSERRAAQRSAHAPNANDDSADSPDAPAPHDGPVAFRSGGNDAPERAADTPPDQPAPPSARPDPEERPAP